MSDITASSCHLKWKPPEDDGGKPITGYVVEKMDKDTGRWMRVAHTEPEVTESPVKGLQEGHEYLFRVRAITDEGESEPLEADAAIKAKNPYSKNVAMLCLHDHMSKVRTKYRLFCLFFPGANIACHCLLQEFSDF